MKPAAKKRRLAKTEKVLDDSNLLPDYSLLPTEILLKIFGYAKGDLLKLTEVCKQFDAILSSQLTLILDFLAFKQVKTQLPTRLPLIKRGYQNVSITGKEIDPAIATLLISSKETARTLFVGNREKSGKKTKFFLRTLMLILKGLPNLEMLTITHATTVLPIFKYEAFKQDDFPILNKLKICKMTRTSVSALKCVKKVNSIEQLSFIIPTWRHKKTVDRSVVILQDTIAAQIGLKFLQAPWCLHSRMYESPSLQELILDSSSRFAGTFGAGQVRFLLPAVKKLTYNYCPELRASVDFLILYNSASVEELHVNTFISRDYLRFNSRQIFESFPALKTIKTSGTNQKDFCKRIHVHPSQFLFNFKQGS